jgi:hypothetical protein
VWQNSRNDACFKLSDILTLENDIVRPTFCIGVAIWRWSIVVSNALTWPFHICGMEMLMVSWSPKMALCRCRRSCRFYWNKRDAFAASNRTWCSKGFRRGHLILTAVLPLLPSVAFNGKSFGSISVRSFSSAVWQDSVLDVILHHFSVTVWWKAHNEILVSLPLLLPSVVSHLPTWWNDPYGNMRNHFSALASFKSQSCSVKFFHRHHNHQKVWYKTFVLWVLVFVSFRCKRHQHDPSFCRRRRRVTCWCCDVSAEQKYTSK